MKKEWTAEFDKHQIRVVNTLFFGASLFIDGVCRDTNTQLFAISGSIPRMSARVIGDAGTTFDVIVFIKAPLLRVYAKICVNGQQIGGDVF